jgi:hypothetical protein
MFLKYVYSKDLKSKGTKQTKHLKQMIMYIFRRARRFSKQIVAQLFNRVRCPIGF